MNLNDIILFLHEHYLKPFGLLRRPWFPVVIHTKVTLLTKYVIYKRNIE